jgi:hypothetical protein
MTGIPAKKPINICAINIFSDERVYLLTWKRGVRKRYLQNRPDSSCSFSRPLM